MKFRRILSAFLSILTVIGTVYTVGYTGASRTIAAEGGRSRSKVDEEGNPVINYLSDDFKSAEEKLATMTLEKEQDGYQLYFEEFTGEIALKKMSTGDVLFSNPYDLASNGVNRASAATRKKLMSQLVVTYEDNNVETSMYSYEEAALRGQIVKKNIKNGIRVEYTVGELATNRLVPRMISKTRFESMITSKITDEASLTRLTAFYKLYDTSDVTMTERQVKEIQAAFPITKQFAVYVCTPDIESKELQTCEKIIKTFCPNYTYEEMDQDHADCDFTVSDEAPPNFKMAIEYTLSEDGLEARLPANGIRFDESSYMLKTVSILPYMGAGRSINTGYTFIPDGSGTLIRFEDVKGKNYNVAGQVYGADYAYHQISGQHSETMRLPVFGVVEDVKEYVASANDAGVMEESGETTARGYFAVITEGDSMATLYSEHGGQLHGYNNVYAKFEPRPSDTYSLSSSVTVGSNSAVRKTSKRKYAGSYRIQYTILTDAQNAPDGSGEYEASYVGMAKAYRDYLEKTGQITKLTDSDVSEKMPLYLETLGTDIMMDTFMSMPVTVNVPFTTFEDVKTVYNELSDAGVSNINFRLRGYYNGGVFEEYPTKVKFDKVLGGNGGFKDLLEYSDEKDFGVYPEFDLVYIKQNTLFDGVSLKRDLAKSIDGRYMGKRAYDAALQKFTSGFGTVVSSSAFEYFTEKLEKALSKYDDKGLAGVSLSTMGTDLNSDFDKEDPYNREDSKGFTTETLASIKEKYSIMVDGGNAYSLPYADHIMSLPTESSNFLSASESVPFEAMVLHGYKNYTGSAINMEGDVQYALLKSIENGASLYFILCYQNTGELKKWVDTSKYYSVAYDIWKDEIIDYYNQTDDALGDLQTETIVDHDFVGAYRVVSEEEASGLTQEELDALEKAKAEEAEREKKRAELLASRGETATAPSSTGPNRGHGSSGGDNTTRVDTESGTVVRVEYSGGTSFIINYNSFDVTAEYGGKTYDIEALSYIRVEKD